MKYNINEILTTLSPDDRDLLLFAHNEELTQIITLGTYYIGVNVTVNSNMVELLKEGNWSYGEYK